MPDQHVAVAPVRRRISPVDPAPGAWAVIGLGSVGVRVLRSIAAASVPVLGYECGAATEVALPARWGHRVIALDEIDDMDLLAVTSEDAETGEINTDYFAGVVLATGTEVPDFADPELLNVHDARPVLAHRTFTPRNPAVLVAGRRPDAELLASVVARYAVTLRDEPRRALAFHRHVCARIIPGWPPVPPDPDDGLDAAELLAQDLTVLQ